VNKHNYSLCTVHARFNYVVQSVGQGNSPISCIDMISGEMLLVNAKLLLKIRPCRDISCSPFWWSRITFGLLSYCGKSRLCDSLLRVLQDSIHLPTLLTRSSSSKAWWRETTSTGRTLEAWRRSSKSSCLDVSTSSGKGHCYHLRGAPPGGAPKPAGGKPAISH